MQRSHNRVQKRAEDAMDIVGCYGCPEEKREAMPEPVALPEPEPVAVPEDDAMDIVGCYGCPEE